ncbi:MAG: precorrin-3B C(17)-methyltransferase [Pseudomonadota bacterium]
MSNRPAIIAITASALPIARRIADAVGGVVHARATLGAEDCESFSETADHLRALFLAGTPIVGVCAAGILVRALAPVILQKQAEPPVLAASEDGRQIIPLLGGHRGANDLARRIGKALGIQPAVTTAGDLKLGLALDAPPDGWRLERADHAKDVMAAILNGAATTVTNPADWMAPLVDAANVIARRPDDATDEGPALVEVEGFEPLIYRRQTLMLGVGCARNCSPDELIALCGRTLAENGRAEAEVAAVVSIDVKSDEAAVHALARHLGVSARFFDAATLETLTPKLANPSEVVFAEVGCHGVAEASALAAAGPETVLEIEKAKSANATVAAAVWDRATQAGMARGRLSLVGIGPGHAASRTPEASRFIAEADTLVGYGLYIDLIGRAAAGKAIHTFPLGGEEDRCRFALEEAGKGRNVALICSGDSGIYAMGALVFELLDRPQDDGGVTEAARRVDVISAPGVTALQAASAKVGAMIGHDFCAISLSDLLTPRDAIVRRIEAAARGDFVIAFYNPVSRKRRTLLAEARDILLTARPAETPVLLASDLGRPNETLRVRTLETLSVDEVDMLTVVLVGSSETRQFRSGDQNSGADGIRIYTPRGYAAKRARGDQP